MWKFKGSGDIHGLAISSDGNYIVAGTDASQYLHEGHSVLDVSEKPVVCGDASVKEIETKYMKIANKIVFLKKDKKM